MCGWTSTCLSCLCIQVGTECQLAIKVILYDVCKWLCYEMSLWLRKRRSVEVTHSRQETVWWIMYLYEKVLKLCMRGWMKAHHSECMFPPTCFSVSPLCSISSPSCLLCFTQSSLSKKNQIQPPKECFSRIHILKKMRENVQCFTMTYTR